LHVLNLVDSSAQRGAKRFAMSINLAQGAIAAGLRTGKHTVDALKIVDVDCERLPHHVLHRQLRFLQRARDFLLRALVSAG
jgi:hypothetical protein